MLVKVNSHRLNVEILGEPASRSFVCIHGLADTLEIWNKIDKRLAEHGRVVLMEQRAHGKSEAPPGPYTRDDMADDVIGVMDGLGIDRSILVGHSAGGIVAMATALQYGERVAGLILLGTACQCNERAVNFYENIASAAEQEGLTGAAKVIFHTDKREIRGDAQGFAHVTRMLKSLYTDPLAPKLKGIHCPVLLVVGDKDPMGPGASEIIRRNLPGASLHVLSNCGHWVHREAPDRLLELVGEFLGSMERRPD